MDHTTTTTTTRSKPPAPKPHAPPPPPVVREPTDEGEEYITGRFLGKGGFAICYEGRLMRNSRVFALKVVKSEMTQRKMAEKFRTELQIHSKLQHPNIVGFHRAFAFESSIYVVLELCSNGSVMDMVKKRRSLTLPEVRRFMVQLAGAVKYMHRRCVAHRDLKMGNLFLDSQMNIKVGDFGLAACIISEKDEKRRRTLCGTPNYIAPEVLDKSKGGHNQKVDMWSIGVIFFAMLTGVPPFQSKTQEEIYRKVKTLAYDWPDEGKCANDIPAEAVDIVKQCLSLDEELRPEPDDLVDHPFFNMYPGCIPKQLDRSVLAAPPAWIKDSAPRGDRMTTGFSLNHDPRYRARLRAARNFEESYAAAKELFYDECGVGRTPAGYLRRSVGVRPTRSVYAECVMEESCDQQPVIPLPPDRIYTPFLADEDDWADAVAGASLAAAPDDAGSSDDSAHRAVSSSSSSSNRHRDVTAQVQAQAQAVSLARTRSALAAAQSRLTDAKPQSHAAVMRQQALPIRQPSASTRELRSHASKGAAAGAASEGRVAESERERERTAGRYLVKEPSVSSRYHVAAPADPTAAATLPASSRLRTASSAHRLQAQDSQPSSRPHAFSSSARAGAVSASSASSGRNGQSASSSETVARPGDGGARTQVKAGSAPASQQARQAKSQPDAAAAASAATAPSKSAAATKSRANISLAPLIHPDEPSEMMPGSTPAEVMRVLERYLISLGSFDDPQQTTDIVKARRKARRARAQPHPYVVKWVDYTNRYGIGYVLDDGSIGCVFKADNGGPASGVVLRHGEAHIRKKARAKKTPRPAEQYADYNQLVPRHGADIEFYESTAPRSEYSGGLRKTLVPPSAFEVRTTAAGSTTVRVRQTASASAAKSEAEKVRRVKLVDQFGKYMIGSLGSAQEEEEAAEEQDKADGTDDPAVPSSSSQQYVKFYQRLGNVGVWGFGDGAFQFNFPDHTKLVLSHAEQDPDTPTDSLACQMDFYHLSASAARYLSSKGKMHPTGFETRAVTCDDISTYFAALQRGSSTKLRDVLEANAFADKVAFIKTVLESWTRSRKLGAQVMPSYAAGSAGSACETRDGNDKGDGNGNTAATTNSIS
ncbi:Cell cycle serine/threonine-protein kinase cdc5/MSD2 [Ascosphaera acerosa]|nr:Cell cycle serine/threonine-protein kinase cdc5/MSD2 [Ascosphaera acerosa]